MLTAQEYYAIRRCRSGSRNNCGGAPRSRSSARGVPRRLRGGAPSATSPPAYVSTPKKGFHYILDSGLDIFRSLWDRVHTLGVLDVEYFNLDRPGAVYLDQVGVFKKIEPVYRAILDVYGRYGIQPLVLMTGQG